MPSEVVLQFNETKVVDNPIDITAAMINDVINFLPDQEVKIPDNIPLVGGTVLGNLRGMVRTLLGNNLQPVAKTRYSTSGDCTNVDAITIIRDSVELTGTRSASFKVMSMGVTISIRAKVDPAEGVNMYTTVPCPDDPNGKRRQRTFSIIWYVDVSLNPGVTWTKEILSENQLVHTPCCTDDGEETGMDIPEPVGEPEEEHAGIQPPQEDCISYSDARYTTRRVIQNNGTRVTKHFICVTVNNCCPDPITVCADLNRLESGWDSNDPNRLVPSPYGPVGTSQDVVVPGFIEHELGSAKGSVDVCIEITSAPTPGQTYEMAIGTDKDEDGDVDRGSLDNELKHVTIPQEKSAKSNSRQSLRFDLRNSQRTGKPLSFRILSGLPESWEVNIDKVDFDPKSKTNFAELSISIPKKSKIGDEGRLTIQIFDKFSGKEVPQQEFAVKYTVNKN